jgi:alpha/beta superfamily hydrolase
MEEKVSFQSDGLKIAGLIDTPLDYKAAERRPAFIVLHGFGGNKDGRGQSVVAKQFAQWGYVTLRIDFRGCGESEGEHGRIICLDQVTDARNALSYLATRPEVDPQRIARVGNISPRPLLLLHSANDSVTPTYESIEMFKKARQPAELHLLADVDHFTFNEENPRLTNIVHEWLQRYFPVNNK